MLRNMVLLGCRVAHYMQGLCEQCRRSQAVTESQEVNAASAVNTTPGHIDMCRVCLIASIHRRQRPRVRVGPHGALVGLQIQALGSGASMPGSRH